MVETIKGLVNYDLYDTDRLCDFPDSLISPLSKLHSDEQMNCKQELILKRKKTLWINNNSAHDVFRPDGCRSIFCISFSETIHLVLSIRRLVFNCSHAIVEIF